ncbi:MAG: hypothetical protein Athens071416_162 [Parcubacteria group bacterium Athens0714_16]|nr:MAG: hypothetical protein Athens071416_162 [Parcubacteria group bacterium Athens0714_16]
MLKKILKKISFVKISYSLASAIKNKDSLFKRVRLTSGFLKDYSNFKKQKENKNFKFKTEDLYPRIYDKTESTPIDPVYFYQDTWCARKIFENKPARHYDVGSKADLIGTISQFIPTTMVDIRPLEVTLPELSFVKGSILDLHFKDGEIASLSSICVIEHIGLGRYGDPFDPFGSEKAAKELVRVLASGGSLYISVPIDNENKVYFNAHRAFTREYILKIFSPLKLVEEKYIYGYKLSDIYDPARGFGTGLYHLKKI